MITAFNNIALVHGGGSYFEMARDIDTDQIFAQKHDMNLLQYELETPKSTFRGESEINSILIVEGTTDAQFIEAIIRDIHPNHRTLMF